MRAPEAVLVAREATNQALARELGGVLRSPLVQAFVVWALAEYMCESTGPWSGLAARTGATALEVAAFSRMFDIEKVVGEIAKVSEAYGKVGASALALAPMLVK